MNTRLWSSPAQRAAALTIIAAAVLVAYANSLRVPFVFDDLTSIQENASIRHLSALNDVLTPPAGTGDTVDGRPLLNLSFALNYAFGGLDVRGYHATNIAIHLGSALLLFGIIRRTLERLQPEPATDAARRRRGSAARERNKVSGFRAVVFKPGHSNFDIPPAVPVAFTTALVWAVHPLHTAAVTYTAQRAESLMGLLFLLTLYSFIRATENQPAGCRMGAPGRCASGEKTATMPPGPDAAPQPAPNAFWPRLRRPAAWRAKPLAWSLASVLACFAGMATKEVMAVAPLVVLLYDRTFLARTFRSALRNRWPLHLALGSSWLLLAWLVVASEGRGTTAGIGSDVSSWQYAATQCVAVVHYLRLAFWPAPLVFDYGTRVVNGISDVWPAAMAVLTMLGITILALLKKPRAAFPLACFFLILAPSSSVVPIATQTVAEHRMYLPLAALLAAAALVVHAWWGRRVVPFAVVLAVGFAALTVLRNGDYQTEVALWRDTVEKVPDNSRAHLNLGAALVRAGQPAAAASAFSTALQLEPDNANAHANLGSVLLESGRTSDAIRHHEEAVRLRPDDFTLRANLANALVQAGRAADAIAHYRIALENAPAAARAELHQNLGLAWSRLGASAEAIAHFEQALQDRPEYPEAHYKLGNVLLRARRPQEAVRHFEAALQLRPDYTAAHNNLGNALLLSGRSAEAIPHFEAVIRVEPSAPAHANLGLALMLTRAFDQAQAQFETALRLDPGYEPARANLARLLAATSRQNPSE